jgi:hypothetical protein
MERAGNLMSLPDLGCVKTPKLNLRTKLSARFQSIWKAKALAIGCRNKAIEKTILRAFRARTFSRSLDH